MALLTVSNLNKQYGALKVTDGVSFEIEAGEALGIIGPNGAGKSTLFSLIAGGTLPDSGSIIFNGVDITRQPAYRRCMAGVGRSHQIPQPFVDMSVFENLLVASAYGGKRTEHQSYSWCSDILDLTGLYQKRNVRAGALTLLERKRLELARALATEPSLLLLDEIAGGLTHGEIQTLIDVVRRILAQGVAIIWIEHIMHALAAVATRLMVLNFGQKMLEGDPEQTMRSPAVRQIYMGINVT